MANVFADLQGDTESGIDAEYGIMVSGNRTYHILLARNYSHPSLCLIHGQIQNEARVNSKDWLFLVEQDAFDTPPEVNYIYSLAEVVNIPVGKPIVHQYDMPVIKKAIREGNRLSDVYLAVALQNIGLCAPIPEARSEIDWIIENLSDMWNLKEDYLLRLIEQSSDDKNEKRFVRINKKIGTLSDRIDEISYELSAKKLKNAIEKHSSRKNVFVYATPEYITVLDELGIDTKSLFKESGLIG